MTRILVADPLAEDGLERLRREGEVIVVSKLGEAELVARIHDYDALVVRSETKVTAPILVAGKKLRVVGRAGVGVDNIDVAAATRQGILVVNAPRGNIVAAAEHTIALLLALARWVPQADASIRRGEWTRSKFIGVEIRGKTLGCGSRRPSTRSQTWALFQRSRRSSSSWRSYAQPSPGRSPRTPRICGRRRRRCVGRSAGSSSSAGPEHFGEDLVETETGYLVEPVVRPEMLAMSRNVVPWHDVKHTPLASSGVCNW